MVEPITAITAAAIAKIAFEEKPEVAQKVEQEVRHKLEIGAVVSANSVAPIDTDDEEDDLPDDDE